MNLSTSDILALIGITLSVVGIPLAVVLGRRGRDRPNIRYGQDTEVVVTPSDSLREFGFAISFSGSEIGQLCRTTIAMWNQKGNTIRRVDIVQSDPLRVQLDFDDTVLQGRLVSCTRLENEVRLNLNSVGKSVEIDFDFLDPKDGVMVEILHQKPYAELIGTLRGAQISSAGRMRLGPAAQILMRLPVQKRWRKVPRIYRILIVSVVNLVTAVTLSVSALKGVGFFSEPRLINIKGYDFTTLAGQAEFAEAVREAGNTQSSTLSNYLFALLILFFAIANLGLTAYVIRRKLRVVIPREILKIDLSILENQDSTVVVLPPEEQPGKLQSSSDHEINVTKNEGIHNNKNI